MSVPKKDVRKLVEEIKNVGEITRFVDTDIDYKDTVYKYVKLYERN